MHFNSFVNCVLAALCYVGLASSALIRVANSTTEAGCQQPLIRREWRALSIPERQSFIGAVRCLQSKPGQTSDTYAGVKSRYDDFVALHITQTDHVHWVGQLLPHRWHRYFLWVFEQSLRETCGYNGAVPYWDWTKDAVSEQAVLESPIFDPIHGFGGNGPYVVNTTGFPKDWQTMTPVPNRTGGGCIEDGPFAHVNISMGPGNHTEYTPHCLRRDLSPWLVTQTLNASKLAFVLKAEDFWHLDHRVEGFSLNISDLSVHGGAHLGIGGNIGEVRNTHTTLVLWKTPIRPLATQSSGCTRKLWTEFGTYGRGKVGKTRCSDLKMTKANYEGRLGDTKERHWGPDTQWAYPYNYFGNIPYKNVTLETPLYFEQVGGVKKIADTMDIQGGPFCYDYE
ncbi:hypothetical protein PG996_007227 [Apiospora saccharicola]|uniref:Tyrosinase copper-binding domain-containing protein n=1 Tax=Apiospora saccharicola TaxID=335842 RepID=A0ABR1VA74_9PEZI